MALSLPKTVAQRQWIIFGIYCWSFLNMGLFMSSLGPILPNLMKQIDVSLGTVSLLFSAQTIGFVFGSVWGGYVLDMYTKHLVSPENGTTYLIKQNQSVNEFLLSLPKWSWWPLSAHNIFSISLIVSGILTALIPFASNAYFLGVLVTINGICYGNINTFGNILLLALFDVEMTGDIDFDAIYASVERRLTEPMMRTGKKSIHLHEVEMSVSIGMKDTAAFVTTYGSTNPQPATTKKSNKDQVVGPFMQCLLGIYALGGLLAPVLVQISIDLTGYYYPSFWLFSMLYIPPGVALIFHPQPIRMSLVCQRLKEIQGQNQLEQSESDIVSDLETENKEFWSRCLIVGIALFLVWYSGAQIGFGAYITTYSTDYLNTSIATGRFLSSANWAGLFAGRCIAVPLSNKMSALNMLRLNLMAVVAGSILLFYSRDAGDISWISSILVGYGLSTLWPSTFLWAESLMPVTGMSASFIVGVSSIGLCAIPAILGGTMEAFGAESFTDIMLILSLLLIINLSVNIAIANKFAHYS